MANLQPQRGACAAGAAAVAFTIWESEGLGFLLAHLDALHTSSPSPGARQQV